jgi:uncharacterized protein YodC (DUF2158 family)
MQAAMAATQAAAMSLSADDDEEVDPSRAEDEAALEEIAKQIERVAIEFPRGTVVTLKCGGPKMVVSRVFYDDELNEPEVMLEVEWFDCKNDYGAHLNSVGDLTCYPQWGDPHIRHFTPDVCQKAD